jgi:hypothetical protein
MPRMYQVMSFPSMLPKPQSKSRQRKSKAVKWSEYLILTGYYMLLTKSELLVFEVSNGRSTVWAKFVKSEIDCLRVK